MSYHVAKCTWQKFTKAPKGSQLFHSPTLIRALKATKTETTAHISPVIWGKLNFSHKCWDDYVSDGESFYRPMLNTIAQQSFTNKIRNIGLDNDTQSSRLLRISASGANAIEKAWTLIDDKHLVGRTFSWEAPITDTPLLWISPKK